MMRRRHGRFSVDDDNVFRLTFVREAGAIFPRAKFRAPRQDDIDGV
jgi:hypothetical protein